MGFLAKWRETGGFAELIDSVLSKSGQVGIGNGGEYFEEKDHKMGPNYIKQCLRKVADGHFTAAVKVLGSSGVVQIFYKFFFKIKELEKNQIFFIQIQKN